MVRCDRRFRRVGGAGTWFRKAGPRKAGFKFLERIVLRQWVQQIVFDCPVVRREVSRNDRENDHGEESKEG
jgi:hypothetical protein